VLGRLAHLLGRPVLSYLREQWRRDDAVLRRKLQDRAKRDLSAVAEQARRIAPSIEEQALALREADTAIAARLRVLEHEVRILRSTVAINAEHRERRYQADVLDPGRTAAHLATTIAAASLHTDPMPHLVISPLLPEDTYRAVLDGIPPRFFFAGEKKKPDLKLHSNDVAPEWTHRVVQFIEHGIVPNMVEPILRRLEGAMQRAYSASHGPELGPRVAAAAHEATGGRLMMRRPGYHLDPHLDPQRAIATCLLYLARPGDDEAFGTQLFRIDGELRIDRTNTYYPGNHGHRCDLVKTVPFRPNSALVFLNALGAHGADIPADAPPATERYSFQFYVSPVPAALAAAKATADMAGRA
jgi:hypothetical protein